MWQDWILFAGQWVFIISLIPTVLHATQKPPISTSIPTALTLFTFAATYATLEMWGAMAGAALVGLLWTIIGIQRWRLNRKEREMLQSKDN